MSDDDLSINVLQSPSVQCPSPVVIFNNKNVSQQSKIPVQAFQTPVPIKTPVIKPQTTDDDLRFLVNMVADMNSKITRKMDVLQKKLDGIDNSQHNSGFQHNHGLPVGQANQQQMLFSPYTSTTNHGNTQIQNQGIKLQRVNTVEFYPSVQHDSTYQNSALGRLNNNMNVVKSRMNILNNQSIISPTDETQNGITGEHFGQLSPISNMPILSNLNMSVSTASAGPVVLNSTVNTQTGRMSSVGQPEADSDIFVSQERLENIVDSAIEREILSMGKQIKYAVQTEQTLKRLEYGVNAIMQTYGRSIWVK